MTGKRKTALVVCPGRGTYNKGELGYLARFHSGKAGLLDAMETERRRLGQEPLADLDGAARFSTDTHTRGDNASLLIHACAIGDIADIDRNRFEIVAMTGNSMGWYIALSGASAVPPETGARIVNTMGTFMQEALIGGQFVYPIVNEAWQEIPGRRASLLDMAGNISASGRGQARLSIDLGGMLVFAGDEAGLAEMTGKLEPEGQFPLVLKNHAAFHTALQAPVSARGLEAFSPSDFITPEMPMVDGRGFIWRRGVSNPAALHAYTFGHQVTETYDLSRAITVAMREYAPDCIIIPGPGTTLGGAVAQVLISINWQGLSSKNDFLARQERAPIILAMGREDQRRLAMIGN